MSSTMDEVGGPEREERGRQEDLAGCAEEKTRDLDT
jgi:hypothetical protein